MSKRINWILPYNEVKVYFFRDTQITIMRHANGYGWECLNEYVSRSEVSYPTIPLALAAAKDSIGA